MRKFHFRTKRHFLVEIIANHVSYLCFEVRTKLDNITKKAQQKAVTMAAMLNLIEIVRNLEQSRR